LFAHPILFSIYGSQTRLFDNEEKCQFESWKPSTGVLKVPEPYYNYYLPKKWFCFWCSAILLRKKWRQML
jgi:hypothetical protein